MGKLPQFTAHHRSSGGEGWGGTSPNVQIRTQEPFSDTKIKVIKAVGFFPTLVAAYECGMSQNGCVWTEVSKGRLDELAL